MISTAVERETADARYELLKSVEQFLYAEARCMDEHRYDDWLALWEQECSYWVPCEFEETDPKRSVAIIYDRRLQLEQRITRLKGRSAFSQQPRSRLIRTLSNIALDTVSEDWVEASSAFVLGDWRSEQQTVLFGRNLHKLRRTPVGLRIAHKKVLLLNSDGAHGNLTFLI